MKKLLLICSIFFLGNPFVNAQLLTESFETDGEGSRYTSNFFNTGGCDYFNRDNNTVSCLTNNPTGTDGSFYWAGEDCDAASGGTGVLTLNALAVTGFALDMDVLIAVGRPNDDRFEPDDELLFQYNMDGGGWVTFAAFYGSNDGSNINGNLIQDTDLNGAYNPGGPEITTFSMQNWNFTIPATGNSVQIRFVMGQDQGTEEIMIDNIRINGSVACIDPTVPTITASPSTICPSGSSTLNWSGTLNDATSWHIYTGSCGGTQITSQTATSLVVSPAVTTTYFIRGEGGCVTPGSCGSVTVTVGALDNASFNYSAASYCVNASDPTPTITGLAGGTFSSTAGLSINTGTGTMDVSASTPDTYTVTYTTAGSCPNSSNVSVTINALDNASFNYSAAAYCVDASDPTPTITGLAGGTFSSTAGLSINAGTGTIDNSASTPGTYTVTYTTSGTCPNSSGVTVTINALDNASFNYSAAAYCVNDSDPTPTITGLAGGTFSSTAGLSINASTGTIDNSASTPGTYTVTYTTAGSCPNSSNVSVTINALDNAGFSYSASSYCPTASDPTPTITGLAGGTFSSTAGLSINAGTGLIDVSASTSGTYTVTYTTTGSCPNSSNVSVTINDAINPTITCPGNQTENPNASCQFTLPDYTGLATASDNCTASPTVTQSPVAGTTISANTTITMTADDGNGNSSQCTFDVVLNDATTPTAVCQNINAYLDGAGNASIAAADIDGGSTDNCSGVTLSASQTAFTCANLGANNVTLTVTDGNSNTANCVAVVTVIDTISPTVACPGNQTENPNSSCQFTLPDYTSMVTTTDNCALSPTITQSPTPGTVITGNTTITMTSDDGNGNTTSCTFDVILNDATAPTAVCQNINAYLDIAGNITITAASIDGGSTDNCSITSLSASQTTFNCSNIGANNVTLTVTDGNSNTANCVAVVTVLDTISPTITCPGNQSELAVSACQFTLPDYTSIATSSDNCNSTTITQSPVSGTAVGLGVTTMTLTADDGNGNTSTCSFTVTVTSNASSSQTLTECDGFSIVVGSNTYTTTGIYNDTLLAAAANGCDSIVSTNLTVFPALTGTVNNTICAGDSIIVNGTVYNAANPTGTEIFTNIGPNNCDSTVTINLTVTSIDITVTNIAPTLTANQNGATYQWLDCDNSFAIIPTETNQAFTATANGNYAVEISIGTCIDTSSCENIATVGVNEITSHVISIYPNPTSGLFTISLTNTKEAVSYILTTLEGRVVEQANNVTTNNIEVDLTNESKGVYLLRINENNANNVYKIVRQ